MTLKPTDRSPIGRTVSITWVIVLVLVVAGGSVVGTAAYFARNASSPAHSLRIADDLGRTVTVPVDPARVAVLSPSIMDIVYRLGMRSHVVAVDCYAAADGGVSDDYSPNQIALWNLSAPMCVQVGPEFAPETLVNLTPQLILASTIDPLAGVEAIASLLGVPVVVLQPPTLSGVLVDDDLIGEIFGVQTAANALNAQLSSELFNATNVSGAALGPLPTVLVTYSVDSGGYWTFGPGTFGLSLIEISGGVSISANASMPYPELTSAQVLLDNPQYIVFGTGFGLNESTYAGGPDWSQFAAVRAGNVTGIDSNLLTEPDPTMILTGLPTLLNALHPGMA